MTKGFGEPHQNNIEELVAAFEATVAGQSSIYLDQTAFLDIIDHYLARGQATAAMKACKQALIHFHYSSDFHLRRAQLLARDQHFTQAHASLDQAEIYSPSDYELSLCRAEIFIMQGQTDRGLATLAALRTEAQPELLADIYTVESLAFEYRTDFVRAFHSLRKALYAFPAHEEALERFVNCMVLSRQYEAAAEVLRAIIDENAYNWRAWYYLGEATAFLEQDYEAMEAYEYAFLIKPDFEEAYFEYAELCFANQLYEKALEYYTEIGDRFTVDGLLLQRKGECLQRLEQYEAARQQLQHGARLEPHNDEIIFQIGACYAAQENWAKAYAFYHKAIRLERNREEYHRALAKVAHEMQKFEEAEMAYRDALLLSPDNCDSWLDLAYLLLDQKRADEALTVLAKANQTIIETELQYSYVAALLATGRRQQALQQLSEILPETYEDHPYLFDWLPELQHDQELMNMLDLYRP